MGSLRIVPFLLLPLLSGPVVAQSDTPVPSEGEVEAGDDIYTWTDEEGVVHYGSQPPGDAQAEQIDLSGESLSTVGGTEVRQSEQALDTLLEGDVPAAANTPPDADEPLDDRQVESLRLEPEQ